MQLLRSIIFTNLFIVSTFTQIIFWTPVFFFMKRESGWKVVRFWGLSSLWLQNKLIGTTYDFRGLEHIPQEGGMIIGAKHQSTWETYTMVMLTRDPSYILKRELILLPFFGWFAMKMKVISVNRGKRNKALKAMTIKAKEQYNDGRQIIIYPEGTRKQSYEPTNYRFGITHMYDQIGARVLPVALNSGLFWPRRGWRVYPGNCILEVMPIIEPGLKPDVFAATLEKTIEDKTAELNLEAENDPIFAAAKNKA